MTCAKTVVNSMQDLIIKNNQLSDKADSSLKMTEDINEQVGNVAEKVENIVKITDKSVNNANESSSQLRTVVNDTQNMAQLSTNVESILREFMVKFELVKKEIAIIDDITRQTNLLSVNASIEAAKAGNAGKSFSVLAQEIRGLSQGTQKSSQSIEIALEHLKNVSDKMVTSINEIISLIYDSLKNVENVDNTIKNLTSDSVYIGTEVQNVNMAMKEVEISNQNMVENMQQVNSIMEEVLNSVNSSEKTTETMLSKFDVSSKNIFQIENIVGALMEELGIGGFMNSGDIQKNMKMQILSPDNKEHKTDVYNVDGETITVNPIDNLKVNQISDTKGYSILFFVGNILYQWTGFQIREIKENDKVLWKIKVTTKPIVKNRRKYPRMPATNTFQVQFEGENKPITVKMINISANGLAFESENKVFADSVNRNIKVIIKDFAGINGDKINGTIIRSTQNAGNFVIGVRLLSDNYKIRDYINANYHEKQSKPIESLSDIFCQ